MTTMTIIKKRNKSEKQVQKELTTKHDVLDTGWISLDNPKVINLEINQEPIPYGKPLPEYANKRIEIPKEIQEKIDSLFKAPKFRQQKENMRLYFEEGLSLTDISKKTNQKDLSNINRSINLGIQKLQKKLNEAEFYAVIGLYGLQISKTNERIDKYNQFTKELKNNMTPTEFEYENEKQHQQWFTPYEKVTIKQGDGRTDAYFHELQKSVDVFPKSDKVAEKHLRFGSPNIEMTVKDLPTPRTFSINEL